MSIYSSMYIGMSGMRTYEHAITVIGDNIAGPSLALRRTRTRGWEKFEMVRAADRHDHLTITVALHGLGEVWLDELQVQLEPGSD